MKGRWLYRPLVSVATMTYWFGLLKQHVKNAFSLPFTACIVAQKKLSLILKILCATFLFPLLMVYRSLGSWLGSSGRQKGFSNSLTLTSSCRRWMKVSTSVNKLGVLTRLTWITNLDHHGSVQCNTETGFVIDTRAYLLYSTQHVAVMRSLTCQQLKIHHYVGARQWWAMPIWGTCMDCSFLRSYRGIRKKRCFEHKCRLCRFQKLKCIR